MSNGETTPAPESPAPAANAPAPTPSAGGQAPARPAARITLRSFLMGVFFAAGFAIVAVSTENSSEGIQPTANQVAVLPYVLLFGTVLLINPLLKLIRFIRPFSVSELLIVFLMGSVSSGIPTYGLTSQFLPIVGSLHYRDWNNDQAQWDQYLVPVLKDGYFLSADGIQAKAIEFRTAVDVRDGTKNVLDKAMALKAATAGRAEEEKRAGDQVDRSPVVVAAREKERQAQLAWEKASADVRLDIETVLAQFPAQLADQDKIVSERRNALRTASEEAFKRVELFRRGLPKEQSAYPGILPQPDDDSSSYFARFKRLVDGRSAFNSLAQVHEQLAGLPETEKVSGGIAQSAAPTVKTALDKLAPLSESSTLETARAALQTDLDEITKDLGKTDTDLSDLNSKKRMAPPLEQKELSKKIHELSRKKAELEAEKKAIEKRLKSNATQREMAARVAGVVQQLKMFDAELQTGEMPAGTAASSLMTVMQKFPSFDASYTRYFFGDVPWGQWAGVIFRWGLLVLLTYVVLMTFNILIFRQWAHNEKLIYPLVELPEILAGQRDGKSGIIPEIFRAGLFWVGFFISGSVLGWNLLAASNVVPGLQPLDLNNFWEPYILGSALQGLKPGANSTVFFTMIGLAFLIPAKVSFSLWFFWIMYFIQLLCLVWLGYGVDENSFTKEWYYTMNFCTAQGGGAMLVFAAVCLYKARQYIFCAFQPHSVKDLEEDERRELRASSFLFVVCSLGLMLMLWQGMGAHPFYVVLFYAIIMCLTIALVRAVAEGGILGFQAWAGPFHFIKNIFGFDKAWSSPALFAPLMIYHAVFFLDIKTFIAPAMANSLKMREDLKMERGRFHLAVFAAILVAMVVAVGLSLMMCYSNGANGMNSWFYSGFPSGMFDHMKNMNQNPPGASTTTTIWILVGASTMGLLLYFRQSMFWLPHPIGLVMLVNPIMRRYWFSILLGWLAKYLVTKYGNRDTYAQTRALFIGLIVGELIIVTLSLFFGYFFSMKTGIDLNRN
ncbi:MAG TPA: DUF6785 family protein [Planctomycetota bacterium]|nr:DUF6785 family protein [Planctomycetota bacterium]